MLRGGVREMSITTKVVSANASPGKEYLLQHYVIKFVSYLRQVGGTPGFLHQ